MLAEVAILFATLLLLLSLYHYVTTPGNLPPGPTPLPIIGNVLSLARSDLHFAYKAVELAKTYGDVFSFQVFSERMVVVNSGAAAREALVGKGMNDFAGRPQRFGFRFVTRESKDIIVADNTPALIWRRKIVHSGLRMYLPSLEDKIAKQVTKLEDKLRESLGIPVNSKDELSFLVLNIHCSFLYGKAYEISDPDFYKINEFIDKLNEISIDEYLLDLFPSLINFPLKSSKRLKAIKASRDEVLDKVFKEHKDTFREDHIRDLLDAFLKAKLEAEREDKASIGEVTDDHVTMIMFDVFLAGLETTTTTLRWLVAYLINYPQVQAHLQADIDDVIGGNRWPSLSDRSNLPYMEATIAEVLRIATVAPLGVPHKATADAPLMGYTIPEGTTLVFNFWAIHHDPREWENPDEFNPSRFINTEGKFEVPGGRSFLPFGAGRRVCLGESLAKTEVFVILSRLLQQFTFESPPGSPPPDLDGEIGNTHYPKPFMFCAKPRKDK